jgi:hypothetical protein
MAFLTPTASRDYFMKRHATTSSAEEREQIEMIAGPDFTFDILSDNEMASVADSMEGSRPTVEEAGNESIDDMAAAKEQARQDQLDAESGEAELPGADEEEDEEAGGGMSAGGRRAAQHLAQGTVIGSEFTKRRA